jgi:hypothetical protein
MPPMSRKKENKASSVSTELSCMNDKHNKHCNFDFAMCHCRTMYRAAESQFLSSLYMVNTNRPLDDVTSYASIIYRSDQGIKTRSEPK